MPIEDRIEQLARLVLVILLIATLGWISHAKAQSATQETAQDNDAPLILVEWRPGELQEELKRGLWEELVKRSERRANAI